MKNIINLLKERIQGDFCLLNQEKFFSVSADDLAKKLIGKWLIRKVDDDIIYGQISEVEAYMGTEDSACHSYKNKKTNKNSAMWESAGTIYVYLCYGMHNMLNIVCSTVNDPQAVLIRGVVGCEGPGRLTKKFIIDKTLNFKSILKNDGLYLIDDKKKYNFVADKRIGIDYAQEKDINAKLRFILKKFPN